MLRVFDPDGKEVMFIGSEDPFTPIGLGRRRALHRKLDPRPLVPYRPWTRTTTRGRSTPGEPVELDIEIWPTSIVVPPRYRLGLSVRGNDYEVDGRDIAFADAFQFDGPRPVPSAVHKDDRPPAIFDCRKTLHFASGPDALIVFCRSFPLRSFPKKLQEVMKRAAAFVLAFVGLFIFSLVPGTGARLNPLSKNVTILVPYPAGGPTDQVARRPGAAV